MKNILLVLISLFCLIGCTKDDDDQPQKGDLTLRFLLEYNGSPLITNTAVPYDFDTYLRFTRYATFISDLVLTGPEGDTTLSDIAYLDFSKSNSTMASATGGYVLNIKDLPAGNYTTIKFGIGVNNDINKTKPSDYPSTNPLSEGANYWAGWNSYIFSKFEGKADTVENGNFDLGFTYHIGMDLNYRTVTLPISLNLVSGSTQNEVAVIFDAKKILTNGNNGLDIVNNPAAHGPGNQTIMDLLVNNYKNAVTTK